MSGIWEIIQNRKTSDTGYTIDKLVTAIGGGNQILNNAQNLPAVDPPIDGATSVEFNTEGYGHGATISYQVRAPVPASYYCNFEHFRYLLWYVAIHSA